MQFFYGIACTEVIELMSDSEVSRLEAGVAQTPATLASASSYTLHPHPYSLSVMQAVCDSVGINVTLQPNHLYVRFLPQDSLQMDRLLYDLNLELFDYPLDVEFEEGEEYVDPTIPEGQFTWQYTKVAPNFAFPAGITYQILEQCYIPEEEGPITLGGVSIDLEKLAFERLGYEVQPETRGKKTLTGTITVYDNEVGAYVPVKGVKIRCHRFLKWSTTFTREDGTYTMDSKFRYKRHYAIVFDNAMGFDIWENWGPLARANYNMGWHSAAVYDRQLTGGGWEWATVNNAGHTATSIIFRNSAPVGPVPGNPYFAAGVRSEYSVKCMAGSTNMWSNVISVSIAGDLIHVTALPTFPPIIIQP